jgi:hypothetical protein
MIFKKSTPRASSEAKAISVQLNGGLGNQLFQFGAALTQAKRLGVGVVLDTSLLSFPGSRDVEMSGFVPESSFVSGVNRRVPTFKENGFAYQSGIEAIEPGTHLIGYFQSWKYCHSAKDEILSAFRQSIPLIVPLRPDDPFIALQVRRGDYLNKKQLALHGICSFDYYEKALEISRSLAGNLPAVVFCDDQEVALEFAAKLPDTAADVPPEGESPADTLWRLSHATGHVIANSSFGWWASWLSLSSTVTIAPRPWFGNRSIETSDLLPTNWLTLDRS